MVSKYGSPEPVERVPLLGFTHLPPMRSSYCWLTLKWPFELENEGEGPVEVFFGFGSHDAKDSGGILHIFT